MDLTAARPDRRLVIVVRADPVICGHSGEARNLAEAALHRGFDDVRIVTWPIDRLQQAGLPLKPLDSVTPYSPGIVVERPEPIGDYKVPDGRYLAGLTGRLVELFTDGVPTVAMSLYLSPHATAIADAVAVARRTGLPVDVVTIAEAVGSDVTNVVRACVENDQFGAAAHVLAQYLSHDVVLAVSQYTRDLVVTEATAIDARHGTRFADQCRERINVSYPAIDVGAYLARDEDETDRVLADRGLTRDGYVLFLSRLAHAKGVDDLIDGYVCSGAPAAGRRLVIAGNGPQAAELRAHAARTPVADLITFLDDVPDDEKGHLMAGCTAFVLPSKPRPEFIETFGIALVEKMLSGGGPVITTVTGGIGEAVGDTAIIVPVDDPDAIAAAIDDVLAMDRAERAAWAERAREYALRFDRGVVLDRILERVASVTWAPALA
ncbi:glycosyltransferase [Cellulomonas wangsupingiae]|uniref:glycosyltransferase n=1 Tax=Cellulomonas wangsupingiae TaxID=2968085 RepID=UPI001D0F2D1F|nr:glycosyltransferase [Cellulomonas wangsupingiae]MCM0639502.1 glycosyltransferase [Cellulomonas wangsupingiae]